MPFQATPELERKIREALRAIAEAEEICRQGAACGCDVQAQELGCQYYRERLEAMQQHLTRRKIE